MKIALGKLWTIMKKQQKPCGAQKLRKATKKSIGSILLSSLHSQVQNSSREIPWKDFTPCGKTELESPRKSQFHGCLQPFLRRPLQSSVTLNPTDGAAQSP